VFIVEKLEEEIEEKKNKTAKKLSPANIRLHSLQSLGDSVPANFH
jgi:hypothetical protein